MEWPGFFFEQNENTVGKPGYSGKRNIFGLINGDYSENKSSIWILKRP